MAQEQKHANVAFFIPHLGCPHRCSFCNQHAVSGTARPPSPEEVAATLEKAREALGERTAAAQVAFFGGSFTAIDPDYRRALLGAARPFLGAGGFSGIRISTRPDRIDREILRELWESGVRAVELGAQSMDDRVLACNRRGHRAADTVRAGQLIREGGFSLCLQMMTGLYGDTPRGAWETARRLAELKPDAVRIYPALVLRGTSLEALWRSGEYRPDTLEEAVALCAGLLRFFEERRIPVIRLGLHDGEGLAGQVAAGPRHPAFRELCEGTILLERALEQIRERGLAGPLSLAVHPASVSKMTGQRRCNLQKLAAAGFPAQIIRDDSLSPLEVRVQPL